MIQTINIIFAISSFFNFFSALFFGSYIYYKNKNIRVYRYFYLSILGFMLWAFSYSFWQISQTQEQALFWSRMLGIGGVLIPLTMFHFVVVLLEKEKQLKKILIFAYVESIIYIISSPTVFFVSRVEKVFEFNFWPRPGIFYTLYILFNCFFLVGFSAYLLFLNYRQATAEKREQIKYVTVLFLLPLIGGITNFAYWYSIPIPPYGNFLAFLYPVSMGYVISRYRFTDTKFATGRLIVHALSLFLVLVPIILFLLFSGFFSIPVTSLLIFILIVVLGIYAYKYLFVVFDNLASKYFYKDLYYRRKNVDDLEKKLISVLNIKELSYFLINSLLKIIGLDKAVVILKDFNDNNYKINYCIGFDKDAILGLIKNDLLLNYLQKNKKALLNQEILNTKSFTDFNKEFLENYKKLSNQTDIGLFLPLINQDNLTGFVILGNKASRDPYSNQDIEILETLSNQISTVLENAKLYNQVQDLSLNLQKKVDEQTKDLVKAYQVEKKARQDLETLDELKNQFMMTTQHHLRTPLTAMRWNADLLLKESKVSNDKKIKKVILNFQSSTEKLIKMVNEFLDITQFQLGKEATSLKPGVDLILIIDEIIDELQPQIKQKSTKIYIKFDKPKDKVFVLADREKLKASLFNIMDNAVKYTNVGGVDISLENNLSDKKVTIKVRDSGIGIKKENLENILNKIFERGEDAKKNFVTGRGVGLYIANKIIVAHKGKVVVESGGEGKGATFLIDLNLG